MAKIKTKTKIVRGRTELKVFPQGNQLTFIHPQQGPHDYQTVGRGILARNLSIPIGEQTAYLVQGAYESKEPEFKEIQDIMKNRWLWVFNKNLWTPDGVYIISDLTAVGLSQDLEMNKLESMLADGTELNGIRYGQDDNVRFAPKETYKLGNHTPESLANDGFVIASYGVNGANALGEVAEKILVNGGINPKTWGGDVKQGQTPQQRVSALDSSWGIFDHRLVVDGNGHGGNRDGSAFGVKRTGEASRV
jgi:hypothetical protein